MTSGIVFDIKEFAVHDGPGIRLTVFLKGCPLRCRWCHNPEGLSPDPEVIQPACGKRTVGRQWTSHALAERIAGQADILRDAGGGVTFSGGEPLMQAAFVADVIDALGGLHVLLDTCGHAPPETFRGLVQRSDLVYYDLKLADAAAHRHWTGVDNTWILANLSTLQDVGVAFVARIPLVPQVTDTPENLAALADLLHGFENLLRVDLLPYNRAAGGKYAACGTPFDPGYNEDAPPQALEDIFEDRGLAVRVTGPLQPAAPAAGSDGSEQVY